MIKQLIGALLLWCSLPLQATPVDLVLTDVDGRSIRTADYRGKWLVLNYWATWCPPCLEEIPELVLFHEQHKKDKAVVIGIAMEQITPQRLKQFMEENFMSYPVVPMVADMPMFGNVSSFPTTYLIDPNGVAVVKHVGAVTADAIEQFINSYVPAMSAAR